nr:hypothetical protein RMQUEJLB_RMQUEJLB_CDS_0010 [Microvirus sp.]
MLCELLSAFLSGFFQTYIYFFLSLFIRRPPVLVVIHRIYPQSLLWINLCITMSMMYVLLVRLLPQRSTCTDCVHLFDCAFEQRIF